MSKTAIIIDDERLARTELRRLLTSFPDIEIVDEAADAEEGLQKIDLHNPDIIFLDINMPGKTGFDLLQELDRAPMVIFTTAYDEYAVKAFEVNALDYLLKPIDPKRLSEALQKAQEARLKEKEQISESVSQGILNEEDQIFIKDGERCWLVRLKDIRMFESVGNYAKVYFHQYKPLILKSLNALEERLDERIFFRANRKFIVNLRQVEKIDAYFNNSLVLELHGGEKIEISRRQTVRFKELFSL